MGINRDSQVAMVIFGFPGVLGIIVGRDIDVNAKLFGEQA